MSETKSNTPTVHEAWANVMADVRELAKGERNSQQGYSFRGIDAVMNACGPVLRRHGVAVVPSAVTMNHRDVTTSTGKPSREATVVVTYTVYGPAGDSFTGMAPGESMDNGDKGAPKAMSVAMRTFMLQALCLPTHDTEPDAETYERGAGPTPMDQAQETADRLPSAQSVDQLERVKAWAAERNLLQLPVQYDSQQGRASAPLGELFAMHTERLQPAADVA